MAASNHVFTLTLLIIAFGFLLKKFNFITEKDGKTISKFLMHTTFPALMITSMANVKLIPNLFLIPVFAMVLGASMIVLAWFLLRKYPNETKGILLMGAGGFNAGLFGFPIIEGLFGKEALVYAIMFDLGNTLTVFVIIYSIGGYYSTQKSSTFNLKAILKKVFSLPPFLAMILGLFLNIFSIKIPFVANEILTSLAVANKPLVLLLMGIYLSFDLNKSVILGIFKVLFVRYLIGFIFIGFLYFSLSNHIEIRNVLMICTFFPVGLTLLPFSDEFNYDSRIAGTLLNTSLIISFLMMYLVVYFIKI